LRVFPLSHVEHDYKAWSWTGDIGERYCSFRDC
jgi:hypothetical protein